MFFKKKKEPVEIVIEPKVITFKKDGKTKFIQKDSILIETLKSQGWEKQ